MEKKENHDVGEKRDTNKEESTGDNGQSVPQNLVISSPHSLIDPNVEQSIVYDQEFGVYQSYEDEERKNRSLSEIWRIANTKKNIEPRMRAYYRNRLHERRLFYPTSCAILDMEMEAAKIPEEPDLPFTNAVYDLELQIESGVEENRTLWKRLNTAEAKEFESSINARFLSERCNMASNLIKRASTADQSTEISKINLSVDEVQNLFRILDVDEDVADLRGYYGTEKDETG